MIYTLHIQRVSVVCSDGALRLRICLHSIADVVFPMKLPTNVLVRSPISQPTGTKNVVEPEVVPTAMPACVGLIPS